MRIAGYWRRWESRFISSLLVTVTFGIMGIVLLINFIQGKQNLGMNAVNITYSHGSGEC
ncbi:hypothetical protein ACXYRK_00710 [Mycoplasma sp. AC1221]